MKKLIVALSLMMAIGTNAVADKPLHRHSNQAVAAASATDTMGIEAYSDTTSYNNVAATDSTDFDEDIDSAFNDSFSDVDDPIQLIAFLAKSGAIGGIVLAIFVLIVGLLIIVSPLILIVLLVYYALRSRRQKYQLVEKAIEKGVQLPENMMEQYDNSDKGMLRRGIKRTALGVGIAVLCYCLGADPLAGIGWLVCCYGLGLIAIGYFTVDKKKKDETEDIEDINE